MIDSRADAGWAAAEDKADELARLRGEFLLPPGPAGEPLLYFAGHSLGLQPRRARELINQELEDWARLGVEGHFAGRHPWMPYHELLTASTARLVGALPGEVVIMNTLSVNLHLLMVSFYRPQGKRTRILIEAGAFPSDRYAVASQARFHGLGPEAVLEARGNAEVLRLIEEQGESIALVLIGSVNYLSGEAFDIPAITRAGHGRGCVVGFDLAHGAGNLELHLHDDGPDFAAWCSYKYLNAGPGACGGAFVHERHARDGGLPRFAGWWGHDKATRFQMGPEFKPIEGAEGWQLSNPPILALAPLRASMELFDAAGMRALRKKSVRLTGYLEFLLDQLQPGRFELVTPREPGRRGTMLTLRIHADARRLVDKLQARGALCDFRAPDIVRLAPVPLYTRYADVLRLVQLLREALE